jgi:predicted nuclease of predicted toxin-antitoxin system
MKILVDENIPATTVNKLRKQGNDVLDIRGTEDQGMCDLDLLKKAIEQKRLFITTDKGFAEHRDKQHYGILIIRLKQPSRNKIDQRIFQAMRRYQASQWPGLMVVMRDAFQSTWKSHHK